MDVNDYKRIYPSLMAFAITKCRDKTLAEDLVSQTILTAVEKLGEGLNTNDLIAWCITVLKNKHLDYIKKKKEAQFNPEDTNNEQDIEGNVDSDAFSNILFGECFNKLNTNYAEVLSMNILNGITTKTIAEILEKPQNTILTWLTTAKLQFHDCIIGKA